MSLSKTRARMFVSIRIIIVARLLSNLLLDSLLPFLRDFRPGLLPVDLDRPVAGISGERTCDTREDILRSHHRELADLIVENDGVAFLHVVFPAIGFGHGDLAFLRDAGWD